MHHHHHHDRGDDGDGGGDDDGDGVSRDHWLNFLVLGVMMKFRNYLNAITI